MATKSPSQSERAGRKRLRRSHSSSSSVANDTSISEPQKPLVSLQAYVSNFFYDLVVQDEDDIFELTYERNWARNVEETGNGQRFNFTQFHDYVANIRKSTSDRQLVSQSFLVAPDDATGRTGDVAHTSKLSGIQDGKKVIINIVSVLKITWNHKTGRRNVSMESFVLTVE